jgi:hypothetical protein
MELLRGTFFAEGLIGAFVIGILGKVLLWSGYRRLYRASQHMDRPGKRWISVLKKKFENYYQLDAHVNNIPCIVDKYLQSQTKLGINMAVWRQLPDFAESFACYLDVLECFEVFWDRH